MTIEKPDGFELRDARSNKSAKSKDWLPADAIYDASLASSKDKPDALLVLWRKALPEGGWTLCWRAAGPQDSIPAMLLAAIRDIT